MNNIFTDISDNYCFVKGNKLVNKLFIIFNSRDLKKTNNFSFFKTFKKLDLNTIFIKSSKNTCFHSGLNIIIDGNITDFFTEISDQVLQYCKINKIQRLYVIGSSMGGYGALLFGHFINTKFIDSNIQVEIIALCPETVLFLPNSRSLLNDEDFKKIVPSYFVDINLLKFYANKISIYFGEYDLVDVYCALKFKYFNQSENIKLFSIIDGNHNIAELLNKRYHKGIFEFFNNMFFYNIYEPIYSGNIANCLNYKDIEHFIFNPDSFSDLTSINECIKKYPTFGFLYNRLGVFYEKNENFSLAKQYFNLSLLLNQYHHNTMIHLNYIASKENIKNVKSNE